MSTILWNVESLALVAYVLDEQIDTLHMIHTANLREFNENYPTQKKEPYPVSELYDAYAKLDGNKLTEERFVAAMEVVGLLRYNSVDERDTSDFMLDVEGACTQIEARAFHAMRRGWRQLQADKIEAEREHFFASLPRR